MMISMEEQTSTTQAPPFEERTVDLTRSASDRMLGGVASGIARKFGIAAMLIRAIFVLLTLAGGLGVALYAAGWFLIRSEDEPESIAERFFARTTGSGAWIGVALVFVALLILLDNVSFLSGGVIWPVGLLVVGLLLYTGDLPRLFQGSTTKEGVQQITATSTVDTEVPLVADDVGEGDNIITPPPPPPTPTPPILPPSIREPRPTSILGRITFGVMLLALGVIAVLDNATDLVSPEPRHYIALAMTVLGIGLLVGAFVGRARWLILVGVVALPVLWSSPALEYNFSDWDSGTVFVSPSSFDDLDNTVTQGVGEMVVDLTQLDWNGQDVDLDASLQIGELRIIVPDDISVFGELRGSIGEVEFDHETSSGFNPDIQFGYEGPNGTLNLNASIGIGRLVVDQINN